MAQMTRRVGSDAAVDSALADAADWLVRLTSGEATADDATALAEWRAEDPAHDAAFRELTGLRAVARVARENPATGVDRRAVLAGGGAALAALATVGVARPPFALWPSWAELMADHRTGPGERYAFAPTPGVNVEMNGRTSVALADDGHRIGLIRGEAYVSVDPTAHVRVEAGAGRIVASDAAFNIDSIGDTVHVACARGRVECRVGDVRRVLAAGEGLAADGAGRITAGRFDPAIATAWRRGLLIFEQTPLADVVVQINRYRDGRLILTDAALGRRLVSGVFHTNQIDNAVDQIQQLLGLRLRHLPAGVVLLG